jgi:hypothetical protein
MHRLPWLPTLLLCAALGARAAQPAPERVLVEPMKTSIYVGTITLVPGEFTRQGDSYTANYEVKVWPWFFWGETGSVTIHMTGAQVARVLQGTQVEFTGEGASQKQRPRKVTGRITPVGATTGKMKIRISADGYTLVFNGTYRFAD